MVADRPPASGEVTVLLRACRDGDGGGLEQLLPLVEAELRRLARIYMAKERRGHTLLVAPESSLHVVDLDRALEALAAVDARKAKVVELRFFGGLSVEETADILHVSNDTTKRDWRLAKLWLLRELEGKSDD